MVAMSPDTLPTTSAEHPLLGRVALVMGASRGIGAATARALARAGARVVLASRDECALQNVAAGIRSAGGQATVLSADVRDEAQVKAAVDETLGAHGRLDVAFNNAGGGNRPTPFAELTASDFDESLSVNLRGTLLCMKYELAAMKQAGRGCVVNMSSTAGLTGVRGLAPYAAAKHGVIGATKSAALDYAADGIRVNVVAPGPILTERIEQLPEQHRAPIIAAVPMRRIGLADEVAAVVVWLCSDAASFMTGAVVPIDGGRLAGAA
jgi:NAD(P)-dependent dehydrogenase (short-subunit alcohol dehydrogenase family)